jgi:septal ring factor EnvC (AmiA/AmiB activator)
VWQFVQNNPAEFVALLSLAVATIGGMVKWMQRQSEKRLDFKIKLLAQDQAEQSERLENSLRLSDMLYTTIEEQLTRARSTETELRDRLAANEAEFAAQGKALREAHAMVLRLEHDLNACKQQADAHLLALEESEAKHVETLQRYKTLQVEVESLKKKVNAHWLEIQKQSAKHEEDRNRLARYDDQAYEAPEMKELGPLPNGNDTDTPEH